MITQDNFETLKHKQYKLDEDIKRTKGIKHTKILDKVNALDVELSEFANEVRFFKFWSNKEMDHALAIEEYIDGLHFFLSIANDIEIKELIEMDMNIERFGIGLAYTYCKRNVADIYVGTTPTEAWHVAFNWFMKIGEHLGFTESDLLKEYDKKNKVNFARQRAGY